MLADLVKYGFSTTVWIKIQIPTDDSDMYDFGFLNAMEWMDLKLIETIKVCICDEQALLLGASDFTFLSLLIEI